MEGELGDQPEAYFYSSMNPYVESGDVEFDMHCFPPVTDPADMCFVHTTSTNFLHVTPFRDTSYAQNILCLPTGNVSTNLRQQPLYINTQLSPGHVEDPDSSTASSSSLQNLLQTPYSESYLNFPPQSASAGSGLLMPGSENVSPLSMSPLSPYPSNFEENMPDAPTFTLPTDSDVVTQSPMPHIIEWKKVIELCGTNDFVPQTVYQPYTEADRKRYIRDVELQETIFFQSHDSAELGIFLDDALKQRLRHLKDKDDRMFIGCGPSVSIRIQWPGYPQWSKQIPTMDFKTPKGPITRAKLAKNIATCIRRFAESVQDKPMEAESERRWKIGKRHIRVEDLILVSLHHVSKGSWQPQLRFRRSFTTFPYRLDEFRPQAPAME